MKSVVATFLILLFLPGCTGSSDREFIISIEGSEGLLVKGSYTVLDRFNESVTHSIEGEIPLEYNPRGRAVSVEVQKQTEEGLLKASVVSLGGFLSRSSTQSQTREPYGKISISAGSRVSVRAAR